MTAPEQIDLATMPRFRLGSLTLSPALHEISGPDWTEFLEPRVMQVLVALAEQPGEAVTRDMLITRCWNGLAVSEDAIQRCIARLRRLAREKNCFEISTLTRVGYRLRLPPGDTPAAPGPAASAAPKQVTIGLVPFAALTQDDTSTSFASIFFDEFVIALSLNRDFAVRLAGPDQNQAYRITGSIRLAGKTMQASLRVLDAGGGVVMARRFDLAWAGPHQPLDDFVVGAASAAISEILSAETERALHKSSDLSAWEAVVRSVSAYSSITLPNMDFAIAEARRALKIDPGYPDAHAALANALAGKYEISGGQDKALAEECAREIDAALTLGRDRPDVLARVATALSMTGKPEEALPFGMRAVELNPGSAIAHLYLGRVLMRLGRPQDALFHIDRFDFLSPRTPMRYFSALQRSIAHFMQGDFIGAEQALESCLTLNPDYPFGWMSKAVLMSLSGRTNDAAAAARRLIALEGADALPLHLKRIRYAYPDTAAAGVLISAFEQAWNAALAE